MTETRTADTVGQGDGGRRRLPLFRHAATLFLVAAAALVLEILAARLIAPYVGMSLWSWTAIIATVLAGLSFGHWLGGLLAQDVRRIPLHAGLALALGALATLAVLPLLRLLAPPLLAGTTDLVLQTGLLAAALFLLPATCAGAVSPLLTRLALALDPDRAGRVLGRMFAAGALGSIFGTLAAGFVLVQYVGSTRSLLLVAGLQAVLALSYLLPARRALAATLALGGAAAAAVAAVGIHLRAFESPCERESRYFCIRVEDFEPLTGRPSRALVLDHLVHGINDRHDPQLLYSPYLAAFDAFRRAAFGERPVEVFHIGGGAYTLIRAWQGVARRQTVAEIDPEVTATARERLWFAPTPEVVVLHDDARRALAARPAEERFDLVVEDAFRDITIPAHLLTREFHELVRRRLKPGGLYLLNLVDRRKEPRLLSALLRTLDRGFPTVEAWLEEEEAAVGGDGRVTWIVVACDCRPAWDDSLVAAGPIAWRYRRLHPGPLRPDPRATVLTDDFAPVERLVAELLRRPELAQ